MNEFEFLFNWKLGKYNRHEIKLRLKEVTDPIFIKPRVKLETELDRLEKLGFINKVETGSWVTPLVSVFKSDGSIRVCADYSATVNNFLVQQNYPFSRIDDVFHALQGGQSFSKIDSSSAYNQLVLDKELRTLLTWSTHKGVYEVNRPFGC